MEGRYPENAGAIFRVVHGKAADFCSCKICIPAIHGDRILKMQEQFSGLPTISRFLLTKLYG